ncbi:MAG: SufD family Fe-S cluster assembly protein [Candidatus Peregrinibacteria bacterium]|nr:SufD family Fe-S cluster assembly protein [Candidatus Peregrinibacteria bacterium]
MKFSLKEHLAAVDLDLKGARGRAFQSAMDFKIEKRDILWLQRLKYPQAISNLEIPKGWEVLESEFEDGPAYKNEKSVFYWLQHALYHQAFTISVKPGVEETVTLPQFPSNVWPLLIIEIGEGATVTIVDDYAFEKTEDTPFRSVVVKAGPRSQVRWYGYQHHDDSIVSFEHKRFILEEGVCLELYQNLLGSENSFDEAVVEMIGDHSEVLSQTVFFGHDRQQQEMRVNHMHVGKETKSNMVSKGAVKDSAHGGFLGYIQMEHGCDGADGNLEEHNLLLSDSCKIDAVPGLEIGYHNVAAAHFAYMERVDDEKLFYLASRGIPKQEAIELIIEGFFLDAIQRMKDESLEQRVFDHILKYLR